VDTLRERGGAATVVDDMRFVRDGNIVSSAGVSAGIDMSLWIIGQTDSPAFAREVQKRIEYYPAPPYTSEVQIMNCYRNNDLQKKILELCQYFGV
jgi:transcriptional regulator GlxA family with amidase domain